VQIEFLHIIEIDVRLHMFNVLDLNETVIRRIAYLPGSDGRGHLNEQE
jgi:hypothetical protein